MEKGGYVLADAPGKGAPDVILMSTGSEVQYAIAAHETLVASGVRSRVVSLPSFELFDEQPSEATQWAEEATEDEAEFAGLADDDVEELEDYEDNEIVLPTEDEEAY